MEKKYKYGAIIFAGVFLLFLFYVLAEISYAAESTVLNSVVNEFKNTHRQALIKMGILSRWFFDALLLISFMWSMYQMIISENLGIGSVLGLVVRTVMYAGFFHWIFNEPTLVMTIPDSLSDLSGMVMGLNGKPDIFLLMDMGNMIYGEAMYKGSMLGGITGIDGLLVAILASVSQVLVYMIVGVILMLQIEIYMVTLCGFVLLIFAGLIHIFVDYAMMYVRALINCGLKYFVCGVVVGVIYKFSVQLFSMLATPDMAGLYAALTVIIGTFAVLYQIVKNISGIVSVILGGAPSIGNGVVPMMTGIVIGGANKAASITKAGAGKAVSGVLSMISSAFSGVNITKPDSDGGDTTKSQISEATGE